MRIQSSGATSPIGKSLFDETGLATHNNDRSANTVMPAIAMPAPDSDGPRCSATEIKTFVQHNELYRLENLRTLGGRMPLPARSVTTQRDNQDNRAFFDPSTTRATCDSLTPRNHRPRPCHAH